MQQQTRILFYLPVVTPWWFANIIVHLIRTMARKHEVHVLVPPMWRNTGIGEDQIPLIADLDHVHWYVLDGPDHPGLRHDASAEDDLIDLVRDIDPALVLCRSADIKTPARFPGTVRYIMEGAAPPIPTAANWVTLSPSLFDHGLMPDLSPDQIDRLDQIAGPLWADMQHQVTLPTRAEFFARNGLPQGKTIIGLPLEYEHEENFFGQHHHYPDNADMIAALAAKLDDQTILAVTNHPLNVLHGDNRAVDGTIAAQGGKVVMLENSEPAGHMTLALGQHCDGMIVGNSKSWSACAAFGTPMMRLSGFATGDWVNAYDDLSTFVAAIASKAAIGADPVRMRRWFAYHLANQVFDPADPALDADALVSRITEPVDPGRWDPAIVRTLAQSLEQAA